MKRIHHVAKVLIVWKVKEIKFSTGDEFVIHGMFDETGKDITHEYDLTSNLMAVFFSDVGFPAIRAWLMHHLLRKGKKVVRVSPPLSKEERVQMRKELLVMQL
jgi:hypothetical protein